MRIGMLACLLAACGGGGDSGGSTGNGGTCNDVVACGGEVEGVWKIASNCAVGDLAQLMNITLVGEYPSAACKDRFRNFTMTMAGTVTFAAGAMTRNVEETWKGTMHFSRACLEEMLSEEVETVNAAVCRRMEGQPATGGPSSSASCKVVSGSCHCDVVGVEKDTSNEIYSIEGNQIVRPGGDVPGRSYCVSGTTLRLKEETQDLPNFAMITTLERK